MSSAASEQSEGPQVPITLTIGDTTLQLRRRDLEHSEVGVDPFLFDPDYSVAAATGHTLWPGSYCLIDWLQAQPAAGLQGCVMLELGAGIGLAGLAAAALGSHVLLTDLPAVVAGSLRSNIQRNGTVPLSVPPAEAASAAQPSLPSPWPGSLPIGQRGGSAAAAALDWCAALEPQARRQQFGPAEADIILAAETVWLKELIVPFVQTVAAIMASRRAAGRPPSLCLWCYRNRGRDTSAHFANTEEVVTAVNDCNCQLRILDTMERDGASYTLFAVSLAGDDDVGILEQRFGPMRG